jgi:hypothetical protein
VVDVAAFPNARVFVGHLRRVASPAASTMPNRLSRIGAIAPESAGGTASCSNAAFERSKGKSSEATSMRATVCPARRAPSAKASASAWQR